MSEEQMILVEDATVSTVTIEVKVLRIGKRQMTQAFFRQLPMGDVIGDDGNVQGTPWGIVRHHEHCNGSLGPHLHVIWQDGRILRHDVVYEGKDQQKVYGTLDKHHTERYKALHKQLDHLGGQWLLGAALEGWRPRSGWRSVREEEWLRVAVGSHVLMLEPSYDVAVLLRDTAILAAAEAADAKAQAENAEHTAKAEAAERAGQSGSIWRSWQTKVDAVEKAKQQIAGARQNVEQERMRICGNRSHPEIHAAMNAMETALQAYEGNYRASYARLAALDQLFIAV